jgi:uncharacterized protein involved in response to NO
VHVVLQTGFRPFFLAAALVPIVALPVWAAVMAGHLAWTPPLPGLAWHAHELIFGFVGAVFAGFFLTATRAWTKLPTASGPVLAGLVLLWLLGRITASAPLGLPTWLAAAPDTLMLGGLAYAIGKPIAQARSTRNVVFPYMIALLALLQPVLWLEPEAARWAWTAALDAIAVVLVVFTGRIVPMFTRNALPDAGVGAHPRLQQAAIAATAALLVVDLAAFDLLPAPVTTAASALAAPVAALAGAATLARLWGWRATATFRHPLIWVLHLGVAWLPAGFFAMAAARAGWTAPGTAAHVLTVGALCTLILAMLTRVALGHAGRPLIAPPLAVAAYGALTAGALLRVFGPSLIGSAAWEPSAGLVALAFILYLVAYAPILLTPRADGKPG